MLESERRERDKENQRIERIKIDVERLLKSGKPRPPKGPWWEAMKKEHQDISEEDLQAVLCLAFDYYFAGAARWKDQTHSTDVELPPVFKKQYSDDAPHPQDVFRIRDRNYVCLRDYATADKNKWSAKREEENLIFGVLPGNDQDYLLLEEWRNRRDLRKLTHYTELVVFPRAPTRAPFLKFPMSAKEIEHLKGENPAEYERMRKEHNEEQIVNTISSLVGAAWKLRYMLFLWSGVTITDEQFTQRMREIIDVFMKNPPSERAVHFDFLEYYVDRQKELESIERIQAPVLIQLAKEQLGAPQFNPVTALVEWRERPSQQLLREGGDLPGFRYWVRKTLGILKPSGRTSRPDSLSIPRPAERPRRPEPPMPEVFTRGVLPRNDQPPTTVSRTVQPSQPASPSVRTAHNAMVIPPPSLTDADRAYLADSKPPHTPTVYDTCAERLLPEVQRLFSGDRRTLLDWLVARNAVEGKYHGAHALVLALLNGLSELRDQPPISDTPAIVFKEQSLVLALLLGSKHIVEHDFEFPGSQNAQQHWGEVIRNLGTLLPHAGFSVEKVGRFQKGISSFTTGEIDFGQGPEKVFLGWVKHDIPAYGAQDTFYAKGTIPYPKAGLVIDNRPNIEPEEVRAMLELLPTGGILLSESPNVPKPDHQQIAPVGNHVIDHGRSNEASPEDRVAALEHLKRYWAERGFDMLALPNYPDLKYTLLRKR